METLTPMEIMLSVDGTEPVTYTEFVRINTQDDVDALTQDEFDLVKNLDVGGCVFLGAGVEIKRVK